MFPLNDDILHEILSIVQDDKPLLCSLARVNKHMSTLVSPYIFRDVDLYVSENILPFNMLRSLVRSINERPSLALHVRSLYLDWEYDNRNHPARLQIFESEANDLFARLINLHTFQLDTVGSNVMCFEYKILRLNPMKALRKVIIRDRVIDIDDVALWLLRPNLEVLMLDGVTHYPGVLQTMAAFHPESRLKNLTRLKLQDPFSIPHLLLQGILQFNPPLKKIKLSKPSYERPMNWPEGETYVPSSAGILNIIQSVRETLVTLTLTSKGNATCKMPFSCDYDCLNMSAFTSLKRLKAPADCFFGSPWLTPSRNGTFKLLLNSLEVLKVYFPCDWYLLYDGQPKSNRFMKGTVVNANRYTWVEEIAVHIKSIKRFEVIERVKNSQRRPYERFEWVDLPASLKRVLEANKIAARFFLRRLKG